VPALRSEATGDDADGWISARRHAIPAVVVGASGVLLVVAGIGKV
jgi:hypothetical protein